MILIFPILVVFLAIVGVLVLRCLKLSGRQCLLMTSASLVFGALFCAYALFALGVFSPSTDTLARQYLEAVVKSDLDAISKLTGDQDSLLIRRDAPRHIAQYGGSEVRNIVVETRPTMNEHDDIVTITFEYHQPGQADWQVGTVFVIVSPRRLGVRRVCASGG